MVSFYQISNRLNLYLRLEYNIVFSSVQKTGRKPCCIREQIIGIVMASQRDFDNVTCVWSFM